MADVEIPDMRRGALVRATFPAVTASLLFAAYFASGLARAQWTVGFPLDDAWIHVRFAQNLVREGSFAFNPGQPTAGSTSPLWVVLLAGGSAVSGRFVATALLLGWLAYIALVIATYLTGERVFGDRGPALVAAATVMVNVRVLWAAVSGMEICLAALLAILASALFAADEARRAASGRTGSAGTVGRCVAVGALFGLASLARPEAGLLFALAVVLRIARSCSRETPASAIVRLVPYAMIGGYAAVVAPWLIFSLGSSGSALPNTFWANFRGLATRVYPPGYYWRYAQWLFVRDHPWVYWFVPVGIAETAWFSLRPKAGERRLTHFGLAAAQLSALWVVFCPLVSRMVLPLMRHHARYMIPLTPFHALLAVVGMLAAQDIVLALARRYGARGARAADAQRDGSPREQRRTAAFCHIMAVAIVLSAVPGLIKWSAIYGRNLFSINNQHVATAKWVRDHTPGDAVVAAHDIGALGAVAQRRVLDLFGLVSPEMLRATRKLIPTYGCSPGESRWYLEQLLRREASYLVGYPEWLGFMEAARGCFEELHRQVLPEADICGGREMVVYRIDAERLRKILSNP